MTIQCTLVSIMTCKDPSQCTPAKCLWLEQGCNCVDMPQEPIPVAEASDSDWATFADTVWPHEH